MVHVEFSSAELKNWNKDVQLVCDEDVATLLDTYEKCLQTYKPEDIVCIVERDGYFACVVNPGEVGTFDLFAWLNENYVCEGKTNINCANARFLFPAELSRGEYQEEPAEDNAAGTGDLDDSGEEAATGFWEGEDEDDLEVRYVRHLSTGIDVPIEDETGVIFGRSSTQSDYPVSNDVVSRVHCRVYMQGKKYMVEDLKSKYGTFINNLKVLPGKDKEIRPGDALRMANEEFKFF